MVKVGLINNRHPMPVQNYIFEKEIENVFDFESIKNEIKEFILEKVGVHTVLNHGINQTDSQSVVTAALVQVCAVYGVELTLMHYDRDTDEYVPQVIFSKNRWRI